FMHLPWLFPIEVVLRRCAFARHVERGGNHPVEDRPWTERQRRFIEAIAVAAHDEFPTFIQLIGFIAGEPVTALIAAGDPHHGQRSGTSTRSKLERWRLCSRAVGSRLPPGMVILGTPSSECLRFMSSIARRAAFFS